MRMLLLTEGRVSSTENRWGRFWPVKFGCLRRPTSKISERLAGGWEKAPLQTRRQFHHRFARTKLRSPGSCHATFLMMSRWSGQWVFSIGHCRSKFRRCYGLWVTRRKVRHNWRSQQMLTPHPRKHHLRWQTRNILESWLRQRICCFSSMQHRSRTRSRKKLSHVDLQADWKSPQQKCEWQRLICQFCPPTRFLKRRPLRNFSMIQLQFWAVCRPVQEILQGFRAPISTRHTTSPPRAVCN